ncbi:MAG: RidA family protein [Hyphomicrobiales bacterium]|nr:RidA family protein [Hyphomicrobiales bacterium]
MPNQASDIVARLAALGLAVPEPAAPVANYVGATLSGALLFVSGQLPFGADGALGAAHRGKVGADVTPEAAQAAARLCALNVLGQAQLALGDLRRLKRCLRVGGFVAAAPGFVGVPGVVNGASDLIVAALGEAGRHARAAVGVAELPLGACVEIEATFEVAA